MGDVGAGVIDADYRGDLGGVLFNLSDKAIEVNKGDRIAQLILERYEWRAQIKEVEDLDDTKRGAGGYGSTGTKAKQDEQTKVNGDASKKKEEEAIDVAKKSEN